jgi:hypothetical protein
MDGVRKRAWLVAASVRSGSGAIPDAAVLGRRPRARVVQGIGGQIFKYGWEVSPEEMV